MNPSYSHFKANYFASLLEGQSRIIENLEKEFFPELEKNTPTYFPTLVRMPTGTGKTGVIGVVSYFGNHSGSTLILTPWKNLCDQMKEDLDLEGRFWKRINVSDADRKTYIFDTERMWPSKLERQLAKGEERLVLIGTLNGLQNVQSNHPGEYESLRKRISLVVVDEGHYEPAVLWGRAVRDLELPTLIVTATPYRNDLKLFRVTKERVFHYEHFRAVATKRFPLRQVKPEPLKATSHDFHSVVKEFMQKWKKKLRAELPDRNPRAIICCENKKRVMEALRIVYREKVSVRAFHERVEEEDFDDSPELKPFFQKTVPRAKNTNEEIWIHQNKLTEGVDDPRFTAVLLTYPMTNDRKLVQQVGRVLRHSEDAPKHLKGSQMAMVAHCADYKFDEVWKSYLEYEKLTKLTTGEHYKKVVLGCLDLQPDYEYFDKRFRKRLTPFALKDSDRIDEGGNTSSEKLEEIRDQWKHEAWNAILTPPSVLILKLRKEFDLNKFIEDTTVAITLRDGVILNVGDDEEPLIHEAKGPILWLYALIKNSDILLSRSAYEISIEARFVHQIRNYLFIGDTGGVASEDYLQKFAHRVDYFSLAKCLNVDFVVRQASLFNTQSLNTAIRRTIRQGVDLDVAPYQISEKKYLCQNLRAKQKGQGVVGERYFGLTTGRISDRVSRDERARFNLYQFMGWAKSLADVLDNEQNTQHNFFHRYASISPAPATADPYAVILDPVADPAVFQEDYDDLSIAWEIVSTGKIVDLERTVFLIEPNPTDEDWPYVLRLELDNEDLQQPAKTEVLLNYDHKRGGFRFKKGAKTEFQVQYKNDVFTVAHLLNTRHDRYAITLRTPSLVYHNRQFFKLDYSQAEAKFSSYIEGVPSLKDVDFEKIPDKFPKAKKLQLTNWPNKSVFSKTLTSIKDKFGHYDWLFCDDPHREMADFIAASFSDPDRKAAFIHCKYGKGMKLSASAFHDLCSQAAKNLVYLRTSRLPSNINTWSRNAFWEGTRIKRWIKGLAALPEKKQMWEKVSSEILQHPRGQVEVWLVMGNGLEVSELKKLAGGNKETPEIGPLLHLLDGLVANCAEANVRLRVFGH